MLRIISAHFPKYVSNSGHSSVFLIFSHALHCPVSPPPPGSPPGSPPPGSSPPGSVPPPGSSPPGSVPPPGSSAAGTVMVFSYKTVPSIFTA
ncbi:hypothetical protein EHV15_36190 [Paenibacillus oralis]|uniref:Uncharacterized protein n=1 Tax=Paenibacillus oralis TaxID=2490856 RepID=A0A3P3TC00_9BACL|nr:hypothetical protein EHV15_36190 [Paenibacillus oralis]